MDKIIRWNVNPEEQQAETYRYWQSVSVAERLCATAQLSLDAYSLKAYVDASQGLPGHPVRTERP